MGRRMTTTQMPHNHGRPSVEALMLCHQPYVHNTCTTSTQTCPTAQSHILLARQFTIPTENKEQKKRKKKVGGGRVWRENKTKISSTKNIRKNLRMQVQNNMCNKLKMQSRFNEKSFSTDIYCMFSKVTPHSNLGCTTKMLNMFMTK